MSVFTDVAQFMVACDQTVDHSNYDQCRLYIDLITEELKELQVAQEDTEALDAVCDLIWVLTGYAYSCGWDVSRAWDEVARSNMGKIMPDGKVHKRADGKVQKPQSWTPPDLAGCV